MCKKIIFIAAFLLSKAVMAQSSQTDYGNYSSQGEFRIVTAFDYNTFSSIIAGIPENIRNVPYHKDDFGFAANMGPIRDTLDDGRFSFILPSLEYNYMLLYNKWEFGGGIFGQLNMGGSSKTERNYTNAPGSSKRGYGSALTYMKTGTFRCCLGLTVKTSYKISQYGDENTILWNIQYANSWQNMSIVTGWDRYDKLQQRGTYLAGFLMGNQISSGPEIRLGGVFFINISAGYLWNTGLFRKVKIISQMDGLVFQLAGGVRLAYE